MLNLAKHVKLRPTRMTYIYIKIINRPREVGQPGARVARAAPVRAGEPPAEVDEVVLGRLAQFYNSYHNTKRVRLKPITCIYILCQNH